MEVGLSERDLQQAQDRPALRVELPRPLRDRLCVRLRVQAVEADQELQRLGTPRVALDPRHRFEGGAAREARRARKRAVEQQALDHALRGDASRVARLEGFEREAGLEHRGPLERVLRRVRELGRLAGDRRRHVGGSLDEFAEAHEVARLFVEHRVLQQAVDQPDAHLYVHDELVQVRLTCSYSSLGSDGRTACAASRAAAMLARTDGPSVPVTTISIASSRRPVSGRRQPASSMNRTQNSGPGSSVRSSARATWTPRIRAR